MAVGENRRGPAATALRLAGASYAEVAEALEFAGAAQAREAVEAHLGQTADEGGRHAVRATDGARLERLLRGIWAKATDPTHDEQLPAVRLAVAIIDRHLRLYGADAPAEVVIHAPTVAEIDAWVAGMVTMAMPVGAIEAVVVDG